ncbi:unnamed protein product [Haemonchus placei]|uniref:PCI domain-containing protein n=1 Tax=Haemonchus placei TaxID=6290 RepID=A0A0N4WD36_HAEPC|nr:unnamed protein product [Haemonchus placei]
MEGNLPIWDVGPEVAIMAGLTLTKTSASMRAVISCYASRSGIRPQWQPMTSSGYQKGLQGSNLPTYLSPQQQQGTGRQNATGAIQYQPLNQASGGYNGANNGYQTVAVTGYSQTGTGYSPISNQISNPSAVQTPQGVRGESQQAWNSQYNGANDYLPYQTPNPNMGGHIQGTSFPQQPQRDDQTGQTRTYQVTATYDDTQRLAGSSSTGWTQTTASPPFTQAPYSQSNVPVQGVFPTAPISIYPVQSPTTSSGTQGYTSSASGMSYTTTPFPYSSTQNPNQWPTSTQNPNQWLTSQGVINPSQGLYGTTATQSESTYPVGSPHLAKASTQTSTIRGQLKAPCTVPRHPLLTTHQQLQCLLLGSLHPASSPRTTFKQMGLRALQVLPLLLGRRVASPRRPRRLRNMVKQVALLGNLRAPRWDSLHPLSTILQRHKCPLSGSLRPASSLHTIIKPTDLQALQVLPLLLGLRVALQHRLRRQYSTTKQGALLGNIKAPQWV